MVFCQLARRFLRSALILNRAARQIERFDALTKYQRYQDHPEDLPSARIIAKLSDLEPDLDDAIEDLETALMVAKNLKEDTNNFKHDLRGFTAL